MLKSFFANIKRGGILLIQIAVGSLYMFSIPRGYTDGFNQWCNRHFWARGYYVDTVGRNKKQIKEYIQNQLREDQIADQMSIKEYVDPFTGSSNQKA